jgi:pyruvate/2-oxoglutarate dehydrogenase complex dihydrolipoamide acyltransferase (E2) component
MNSTSTGAPRGDYATPATELKVGSNAIYLSQDAQEDADAKAENAADTASSGPDVPDPNASSPEITPEDLKAKTQQEIRELAQRLGLRLFGDSNHPLYPRKWKDPETKQERLRLDPGHTDKFTGKPVDNPRAAVPHVHGYTPDGAKIGDPDDISMRYPKGDPHFPTTGP